VVKAFCVFVCLQMLGELFLVRCRRHGRVDVGWGRLEFLGEERT
jgi:hypothetical protein